MAIIIASALIFGPNEFEEVLPLVASFIVEFARKRPLLAVGIIGFFTAIILTSWRSRRLYPLGYRGPFDYHSSVGIGWWTVGWTASATLLGLSDIMRWSMMSVVFVLLCALLILGLPLLLLLTGGGLYLKGVIALSLATYAGFVLGALWIIGMAVPFGYHDVDIGWVTSLTCIGSSLILGLAAGAFFIAGVLNSILTRRHSL